MTCNSLLVTSKIITLQNVITGLCDGFGLKNEECITQCFTQIKWQQK